MFIRDRGMIRRAKWMDSGDWREDDLSRLAQGTEEERPQGVVRKDLNVHDQCKQGQSTRRDNPRLEDN